jgi:hypothetical protein
MKKSILYLLLTSIIFLGFIKMTYASSNHYLPGGKNYIDNENLTYLVEEVSMNNINPILVKPETDYVISINRDNQTENLEVYVQCYHNDQADLMLMPLEAEMEVENEVVFYYHFKTSENCNYISFELIGFDYQGSDPGTDHDLKVQLEEGLEPTAYEPYIAGSILDTTSPYFQSSGTIISYVDEPISLAEIQDSLSAYDTIDGDVTSNITLVSENYSTSMNQIGSYELLFSVSDTSDNTSQVTVTVEVVDVLAPVFSDLSEIISVYPNVYTVEAIIEMLSASDNYDGDISRSIEMVEDNYSANASLVGTYSMTFRVFDSSNNEATHVLDVHVVDEEAPLISGQESITIGYNQYYEENQILSNLSVTDNYDESIAIVVESNIYKDYSDLIGQYEVLFSATDSSGNRTEKIVIMNVVDEIGPMIYLDSSVIQVYSDTVLQLPDFAHLLTKTNELDPQLDYRIIVRYDSYTKHASKPGTYHMKLTFKDNQEQSTDKDFEIKVIDKQVTDIVFGQKIIQPNFYEKYKEFIIYGGLGTAFLASQIVWFFVYRKKNM